MEVRNAIHPEHAKTLDSNGLRREFHIRQLLVPGEIKLVYSHIDRIIIGGVCPRQPLALPGGRAITGSDHLLKRREMGIINVGASGTVTVDGVKYGLKHLDGLYIGMGAGEVRFYSEKESATARFYLNCATAHHSYPTAKIELSGLEPVSLGSVEEANQREIFKYIHPQGVKSCQLVMGFTRLKSGNVWNTMPCHTHVRRMEVYFYFDMSGDTMVFHLMGEPRQTRHIIMRNEEAVISPSWSIHSGVGTRNYSFVWGMVGENQIFDDMDAVEVEGIQ